MSISTLTGRVLIVGRDLVRNELRTLLPASSWDVAEASCLEQACFVQVNQPCDVLLVDGVLASNGSGESIAWLVATLKRPLVLVSESVAPSILLGVQQGAVWLPVSAAREHPQLLAATLGQAITRGEERRRAILDATRLREAYGRIDRLLGLLWEAAPGTGPARWYSQSHMLERLDEEVARLKRHGGTLSLVLGEVAPADGERLPPAKAHHLAAWVAQRLAEHKRRCDVAGRYGLDGFILVLPRAGSEEAQGACRRFGQLLTKHEQPELPALQARFGHASAPRDAATVQALLRHAEEKLSLARDAG